MRRPSTQLTLLSVDQISLHSWQIPAECVRRMNQKSLRRCSKLRCEALSTRSVANGEPYLSHPMTWSIYFSRTRRLNLVKRFGFFFLKKKKSRGSANPLPVSPCQCHKNANPIFRGRITTFPLFPSARHKADGSTMTLRRSFRVRTVTLAFPSSAGIDPRCGWLCLMQLLFPPSEAAGRPVLLF